MYTYYVIYGKNKAILYNQIDFLCKESKSALNLLIAIYPRPLDVCAHQTRIFDEEIFLHFSGLGSNAETCCNSERTSFPLRVAWIFYGISLQIF